jgi:hypothetical protein
MPTGKTIADVIEAHRQELKATHLSVTLGPDATPEGLDAALKDINRRSAAWAAYSELEREQAKVHRLRQVLRQVCGKTRQPLEGLSLEEYSARLRDIFGLTDLVADVDIENDTAWMREQREKRGEALPAPPQ